MQWLTVPIRHERLDQLIDETWIDNSRAWTEKHFGSWKANYSKAPYFRDITELLSCLDCRQDQTISQLNIKLIRQICEYLNISTPMLLSRELSLIGSKTDRLIDLLKKLDATTYLSGPSADSYLDKQAFREHGIRLEYKSYEYLEYPQLWGDFEGAVTVLDLIANCGPDAKNYIQSQTPNKVVVEFGLS
ncbi:hypothetical protein A1332_09485 [Methylomonas methanica]|uniref:WbqC-like protein n=1 Tax=Methylomonas methanica TaxID=421 RepID=A0A177MMS9_METMH|nr:hypothetical protein A1332_09485 [Methylomonas methanica]